MVSTVVTAMCEYHTLVTTERQPPNLLVITTTFGLKVSASRDI